MTATRRRAAWPTLTLTLLALLAVLGTLLLTGGRQTPAAAFTLQLSASTLSVTPGDSAQLRATVTATHGFTGTVRLDSAKLPDGVQVQFGAASIALSAAVTQASTAVLVQTASTAHAGSYGLGIIASGPGSVETSLVQLVIQQPGVSDLGPPPVPPVAGAGTASFTITGNPRGVLAPGAMLPVDVQLANPNPEQLSITGLQVSIASIGKPACTASNFAILPYRGSYPLTVPAQARATLSELGIPIAQWPQLVMKNLPTNQDACKGAVVRLRFSGAGSGS